MTEKPVVYVCSNPADKDWADKFLQSLRPTLGQIATADGSSGNGASSPGGETATYREVLERTDLDMVVDVHGEPTEVRDIVVHMIEEYARHCGHADLVRECIDGRAGQ